MKITRSFVSFFFSLDKNKLEEPTAQAVPATDASATSPEEESSVDTVLLEILVGANDAVVKNLDTDNLGLLGVVTVAAAFLVLVIDKQQLGGNDPWSPRGLMIVVLGLTALVYTMSILRGRDAINASRFAKNFRDNPAKAVAKAIRGTERAYTVNNATRLITRAWQVIAIVVMAVAMIWAAKSPRKAEEAQQASPTGCPCATTSPREGWPEPGPSGTGTANTRQNVVR